MRAFIIILIGALLVGCRDREAEDREELQKLQAKALARYSNRIEELRAAHGTLRREDDRTFSEQERRLIAAARRHLESGGARKVDAYYKVTRRTDHFEVYVSFVAGHRDGQPLFIPGGFCVVLVREDESVIRVLPGA